jgi:hypothetical protein
MAALPKVTASMGMGDTASSASGGSEVDVAVVQVRSGAGHRFDPPSGTPTARCSLHGAPQRRCRSGAGWAIFSLTCLPGIGNLVLASTTPRGDKIVTSEQTGGQRLVDSPGKNFLRGRAGAVKLVPTSTGAARATTLAVPELVGRFDGIAVRAPIPVGSIADIVFVANRPTTVQEVNDAFRQEAS